MTFWRRASPLIASLFGCSGFAVSINSARAEGAEALKVLPCGTRKLDDVSPYQDGNCASRAQFPSSDSAFESSASSLRARDASHLPRFRAFRVNTVHDAHPAPSYFEMRNQRAASTPPMNPPRCPCQLTPGVPGSTPNTVPPHSTATARLSRMLPALLA